MGMRRSKRPRVICHMASSVDGRLPERDRAHLDPQRQEELVRDEGKDGVRRQQDRRSNEGPLQAQAHGRVVVEQLGCRM
jgi:hypothetical protein